MFIRLLLWVFLIVIAWTIADSIFKNIVTGYRADKKSSPDPATHENSHPGPAPSAPNSRMDIRDAEFYDLDDRKDAR